MRGKAIWVAAVTLLAASASAAVIYATHPSDPHDEGLLVGTAAMLWPFGGFPIAWLLCVLLAFRERSRHPLHGALAVVVVTGSAVVPFCGYWLNQKPWLSAAEKLADPWPDVRAHGAALLASDPDGIPLLAHALQDNSSQVRVAAAGALAKHGDRAASSQEALVAALDDQDWYAGCQAAEALAAMPSRSEATVPILVSRMSSPDSWKSWCSVKALGLLGPKAAPAVPALQKQLAHGDPNIRSAACEALGLVGSTAKAAVPALRAATSDDNQWVRKAAREAILRLER